MDDTLQSKLKNTKEWLQNEYSGIRTGQAAPALLDSIKVESYGTHMPLNQVGSIGAEDARTLRITPWDAGTIGAIERAIVESDLGVSVATDSSGLRVIFPELTSERRVQLEKLAKSKLEDARVRVRASRDDAIKQIDAALKAGDITEDDKFSQKDDVQKQIDAMNNELEALYDAKTKEINS